MTTFPASPTRALPATDAVETGRRHIRQGSIPSTSFAPVPHGHIPGRHRAPFTARVVRALRGQV